eukprot:30652-Pelagococcus_subviridis.AAC.2
MRSGISAAIRIASFSPSAARSSSWSDASSASERRNGCASFSGGGRTPAYWVQNAPPSPATASTMARARTNSHVFPASGAAAATPARTRGQDPSDGSARPRSAWTTSASFFGTERTTSPMSTPSLVAKRPRPCSLSRGDARANATPELSPRSRSHGSSAGRQREVSSSSIVLTSADVGTREETPKRWLARTGPARSTRALPAWVVRIRKAKGNWRRRASIPVPLACEASALPIELRPLDRCQGSVHRASSLKLGWQVL